MDLKVEAGRLAKTVQQTLGIPVRIRAGAPGSLNVFLNGQQIYSRKQSGQPPDPEAIISLIRREAAPQ